MIALHVSKEQLVEVLTSFKESAKFFDTQIVEKSVPVKAEDGSVVRDRDGSVLTAVTKTAYVRKLVVLASCEAVHLLFSDVSADELLQLAPNAVYVNGIQ